MDAGYGRTVRVVFAVSLFVASGAYASRAPLDPCTGLKRVSVGGTVFCTHGGDGKAPIARGPGCLRAIVGCLGTRNGVNAAPAPCATDGTEGARVQVFYARPAGTRNDYARDLPAIRDAVSRADLELAQQNGWHFRWLCPGGVVAVTPIVLPPGARRLEDFIAAARAAGYARTDRVYTAFLDNVGGISGFATIDADDRPTPDNENNVGPAYSVAVAYNSELLAHELGHNLGGVQLSAPHSTGAWHCYDAQDAMCYDDGGPYFQSGGSMVQVCPSPAPFDCGSDDYFAPAPGDYLSTHWNLARSRFLTY